MKVKIITIILVLKKVKIDETKGSLKYLLISYNTNDKAQIPHDAFKHLKDFIFEDVS